MNFGNGHVIRLFVAALFIAVGHLFAFDCLPAAAQAWDAPACGNCFCVGDPKTRYKCDGRFLYCACHEGPNVQLIDPLPRPSEAPAVPVASRTTEPSPATETVPLQPQINDWRHFGSIYCFVVSVLLGWWQINVAKARLLRLAGSGKCVREHRRRVRHIGMRFAVAALVFPPCMYLIETWWH